MKNSTSLVWIATVLFVASIYYDVWDTAPLNLVMVAFIVRALEDLKETK